MSLVPGSKLGPYEILAPLGAGGMGEVYRARDPRLGREVAIKVLPAERMADEERRRRFVQEARAASALNHPNIVTIHEIDSVDGIDFIVMEYVAGKTLDLVIPMQGMRLPEALQIAIPMADALARAHAAGIVHRDIKPSNVALSDAGQVKVLDFGLAKLVVERKKAEPKNETQTEAGAHDVQSRAGNLAGTVGYMSPEQATGGEVDARSDVFSFGAVLYEMVTGRRAFAGDSAEETQAAVVSDEPRAPSEMVARVPKGLDRLILRCLKKERDRRYQNMLDVKVELQEIKEESEQGRRAARPGRRRRLLWIGAGLILALVLATATVLWRQSPEALLEPPRLVPLTSMRGEEPGATLSPDGDQVAFAWNGEKQDNFDIYVKMIGSSEMRRLTTDPAWDIMPTWSPDGRQIAFVRLGPDGPRIHLISPLGGAARKLSDFPLAFATPSWSPDGRWLAVARAGSAPGLGTLFSGTGGLYLLPVNGGEPRALRIPQESGAISGPQFAPDGRHLAYASGVGLSSHLAVVELGPGPDYMPSGAPRRITRGRFGPDAGGTWTRDGKSFIYGETGILRLWRVEITGGRAPQLVEIAGFGAHRPATAPRRDRLVFVKEQTDWDIYRFEVGRPDEPAITSSFADYSPQFSPDGRRVAFESDRSGEHEIWLAEPDGSNPVQLTRGPGFAQGSPGWSPDGRRIAFDSQGEGGHWDIWTIDADGASPRRLTLGPGDENNPSWSRDGRFIYFAARPEGAPSEGFDVWRAPAVGGAEERITQRGGFFAHESVDGKTLFFLRRFGEPSPLFALPLAGGPEREVVKCVWTFAVGPAGLYSLECSDGPQAPLFLRDPATGRGRLLGKLDRFMSNIITVSPDGKTILYTKRVGQGSDLMMIDNFR